MDMPSSNIAQAIMWSEQLASGLDDVDAQHHQLIDILNELIDLRRRSASVDDLVGVFDRLRSYTVFHFQCEADQMQSFPVNAANRASHLKSHQNFIDYFNRAAGVLETDSAAAADQLLAYLVKWLVHHITGVDARMAREIQALRSGIQSAVLDHETTAFHNSLIDVVSELDASIGDRTFEMVEMNQQLRIYQENQEQENSLAQDIIMRLVQRGSLSDSKLSHWTVPATTFSGDIVSAIRSPKGFRYAILADATGHGLAAAITVLPVLTTFYSMAERDLPISAMVIELNKNLLSTLPTGRFVSLALLYIDERNHIAEVWNGGMPEIFLLGQNGEVIERFGSTQLPLGIVRVDEAGSTAVKTLFADGNQFVMYSDGLIETASPEGEPFGMDRLEEALTGGRPSERIQTVQNAWMNHVESAPRHDDISLLLVE